MKEIIQKAVEGGYPNDWGFGTDRVNAYSEYDWNMAFKEAIIQVEFWQALAISLGWETSTEFSLEGGVSKTRQVGEWLDNWHLLIDHLADGKDAESFFKNLL